MGSEASLTQASRGAVVVAKAPNGIEFDTKSLCVSSSGCVHTWD